MHGGVAQGVGQALLEHTVYDDKGQLVTGSYMDYAMPRADNFPSFKVDMTITKCPSNPLGIKGCGEAGAIAAPAAVMNAITNALGTEAIDHAGDPAGGVGRAAEVSQGGAASGLKETENRDVRALPFIVRRRCARRRACSAKTATPSSSPAAIRCLPTMKLRLAEPAAIHRPRRASKGSPASN